MRLTNTPGTIPIQVRVCPTIAIRQHMRVYLRIVLPEERFVLTNRLDVGRVASPLSDLSRAISNNKTIDYSRQFVYLSTDNDSPNEASNGFRRSSSKSKKRITILTTDYDGVAWRGLFPLLMEAPSFTTLGALMSIDRLLSRTCQRNLEFQLFQSLLLLLIPPTQCRISYLWEGRLILYERTRLSLRSRLAWTSTLGGGHFGCRQFLMAIVMARHQRAVALSLGDVTTANKCLLHEAYNHMYAGNFRHAQRLLRYLKAYIQNVDNWKPSTGHKISCYDTSDESVVFARMVLAAISFLRQIKIAGKYDSSFNDATVDDFQRIKIVPDRSERVLRQRHLYAFNIIRA
jgi:hypothetical protein